jgi:hypothetical protein
VVLTPPSRFGRRIFEMGGDLCQRPRDPVKGPRIDAIEEPTPDAGEVNRPRGLEFGHTPRSEPRNVPPGVGGTCGLGHEATRLEIVHETGHPACRQVGGGSQVGHPQLAIGSFGKMHDRRVIARRQASTSDEVAIEMTREDFDNSHHCAPQRFLCRRKRLDGGHTSQDNLLHQARPACLARVSATAPRLEHGPGPLPREGGATDDK